MGYHGIKITVIMEQKAAGLSDDLIEAVSQFSHAHYLLDTGRTQLQNIVKKDTTDVLLHLKQNEDWMEDFNEQPFVYINPRTARSRNIADGDRVKVTNRTGHVTLAAKLTDNVPADAIMMYEAWFKDNDYNCQNLVDDTSADMGAAILQAIGRPG